MAEITPDELARDLYEERAAIRQFDGGQDQETAERAAWIEARRAAGITRQSSNQALSVEVWVQFPPFCRIVFQGRTNRAIFLPPSAVFRVLAVAANRRNGHRCLVFAIIRPATRGAPDK